MGYASYYGLPYSGQPTFTADLRANGWGLYVTGLGSGADATVTVTSTAAVKPYVVVTRFAGSLPLPP